MFKTYVIDTGIENGNPNQIHKAIHRLFHRPDQAETCPRFYPTLGTMCRVRSETAPIAGEIISTIDETVPTGRVLITFLYAAVGKRKGKCFGFDPKDRDRVKEKISATLEQRGFTVETMKYTPVGFIKDPEHGFRFPYGQASVVVIVDDREKLEKLMLEGIGREKYLGMGYVEAIPAPEEV